MPAPQCVSSGDGAERGAVAHLVLALGFVALTIVVLGTDLAVVLGSRAQAQVAADAAALAAAPATFYSAATPAEVAGRTAEWNGARFVECICSRDPSWRSRLVTVRVAVPADLWLLPDVVATATARAEFDPTRLRR